MVLSSKEKVYGSPPFTYNEISLTANGWYTLDFRENHAVLQAKPFDEAEIDLVNCNSDVDIYLDGNKKKYSVPKSSVRKIVGENFSNMRIKEMSGLAVSSGNIKITVRKSEINADTYAREQYKEKHSLLGLAKNFIPFIR